MGRFDGKFKGTSGDDRAEAHEKRGRLGARKKWGNWTMYGYGGNDILTGGPKADKIYGHDDHDRLYGLKGDDRLNGGNGDDVLDGGAGSDQMTGGPGDDTYYVDNSGDRVAEDINGGIDRVYSSISYTLDFNIENLSLMGSAYGGYGNFLSNQILGTNSSNALWGADGSDQLYGYSGSDNLRGGNGHDRLYGGNDNDVLYGNSGFDYLDGGAGADWMSGGTDNDRYVVDNVGDRVIEYFNQGIDQVTSSIDYILGRNVEQLRLTGTAVNGTGNTLDNSITGNRQNNTLNGADGNDTLYGESGSDTLVGGNGADTLIGGGTTLGEYDILTGGAGHDTFVLDHGWGSSYEGVSYATITDLTVWDFPNLITGAATRIPSDTIQVVGSLSDYRLHKESNRSGSLALDTVIYKGSDVIGVVEDTTKVELNSTFFTTVPESVLT